MLDSIFRTPFLKYLMRALSALFCKAKAVSVTIDPENRQGDIAIF